ncbi:MAG: 3-isopropylmalate dehydrogenase, partial [Gammaproteobacteria bacterium]|nr:3-isopropylmalate dehydrogenase [Gammaproteobacteria bacterium]
LEHSLGLAQEAAALERAADAALAAGVRTADLVAPGAAHLPTRAAAAAVVSSLLPP